MGAKCSSIHSRPAPYEARRAAEAEVRRDVVAEPPEGAVASPPSAGARRLVAEGEPMVLDPVVITARAPAARWRPAPSRAEVEAGGVVKRGHHGPMVEAMQAKLREAGHEIEVDGLFGPKSEAALRAFQGEAGLEVDGKLGPNSLAALFAPAAVTAAPASARTVYRAALTSAQRFDRLAPAHAQSLLTASPAVLSGLDRLFRSRSFAAAPEAERHAALRDIADTSSDDARLALIAAYARPDHERSVAAR